MGRNSAAPKGAQQNNTARLLRLSPRPRAQPASRGPFLSLRRAGVSRACICHGSRLKAGMTAFGAAPSVNPLRLSSLGAPHSGATRLRGRSPTARRRPEDPAVGAVCACGWTPAAKARTPGLHAVPGSPRMALRDKPKGRGDDL